MSDPYPTPEQHKGFTVTRSRLPPPQTIRCPVCEAQTMMQPNQGPKKGLWVCYLCGYEENR